MIPLEFSLFQVDDYFESATAPVSVVSQDLVLFGAKFMVISLAGIATYMIMFDRFKSFQNFETIE